MSHGLTVNIRLVSMLALFCGSLTATLRAQLWDGGGGNDRWNTGANWSPNGAPDFGNSTDLVFNGSLRTLWDMNGDRTVNMIRLGTGAADFTLLGGDGGMGHD